MVVSQNDLGFCLVAFIRAKETEKNRLCHSKTLPLMKSLLINQLFPTMN